jgi:hypothetical protein
MRIQNTGQKGAKLFPNTGTALVLEYIENNSMLLNKSGKQNYKNKKAI